MLVLCLIPSVTHYAQNYAGIIGGSLHCRYVLFSQVMKQDSFSHVFLNVMEHYRSSAILECNTVLILRAVATCHKAGRGSCTHIIQITSQCDYYTTQLYGYIAR